MLDETKDHGLNKLEKPMVISESPVCEIACIHTELIESIRDMVIPSEQVFRLAELFKTLGDPTRIRILDALTKSEFCVCDLVDLLKISQSALSHQLRILRNNHLVKYRKEGKMVYYALDDSHVLGLYREGLEHISERRN